MASTTTKSAYLKGCRDVSPFILVAAPFGLLFGVLATEAGLNLLETMTLTVTVFAGASQLTALQLLQEGTPMAIALLSALAVNLRLAMYSASLTPYLGAASFWRRVVMAYFIVDQTYALNVIENERRPGLNMTQKIAYFFGTATPLTSSWYLATLAGAALGAQIPESFALDFALPIAFLAMIGPMLRTGAHVVAALVSCAMAITFAWLPYNLGLIVAGIAAMMAGAQAELMLERRKAER